MESLVLDAARELFDARQFPGVAAVCAEALAECPRDVSLRMLRARALLALRRDAAAQVEVGEVLRIDPRCAGAYRLLGELAARRDELRSARRFLREALRFAPSDEETTVWLELVDAMVRPAAVAAAGPRSPLAPLAPLPPRAPHAHVVPRAAMAPVPPAEPLPEPDIPEPTIEPAILLTPAMRVRAAPTIAMTAAEVPASIPPAPPRRALPPPLPAHLRPRASGQVPVARASAPPAAREAPPPRRALPPPFPGQARAGTPPPAPVRAPVRRLATVRGTEPPPVARPATPPPSGFGAYLVDVGVLSDLQLRASLAYKKSTGVRLGAAAVALGFATEARLESASLVYHGRHRRPSTIDVVATARGGRRAESSPSFRI